MKEEIWEISLAGTLLSNLSIDFQSIISKYSSVGNPDLILITIQNQAHTLNEKLISEFNPVKATLLRDFRNILDPRL